jgi:WD40 repeat protein
VTRSTGVFHYQLGGPQRQGAQSGSYFAVASLTDPSQPIRRTEIPASPRFGVSDRFLAVGYSWLDGNENENTVSVYNHQTGELEIEIDPAGGTLLNVAISPDEYYIACAGEHAVEVFWRLTGERVGGWDKVPSSVVDTFIPHPDNFFINRDIIVRNRRESIWYSLDHRQPVARFTHLDNPAVLQFSSGGRYAIWTGTRHSQFVDLFGRECLRVPVDGRMASWVSFSPDARFLMATGEFHDDRSITTVCDAHSGRSLYEFPGVRSSFSPDGKWIANWTGRRAADTQTTNVLTQRELHLWDVRTGEVAATARCPFYPSCVLFSGDGNLVAASGFLPGHFAVWRVTAGEIPRDKTVTREVKLEQVFSDPKASGSMAISRSGDRIAYVIDQGVRIHHFRDEQLSTTIGLGQRPGQQSLAFVDDDHLLVLAGKLQLWNVSTGKLQYESGQSHQPPLVLSPDRKHLFCRRKLIRTSDFVTLLELPGRVDRVWVAQWSPDGRRLALGLDGGEVGIWNLQTIETLLHERSLPATGIEFVERSKMESFDQLVRIGRSATDRSDQYQWDLRYYELMEVLSRDQPDRNTWLTELAWLCERFDREVWQPFFDSSPSGVDRAWLNRIDRGYDLAMRLQEIKEYDQQKDLLRSMQSSFEGIDSPTPEMKRKISLVYHTSGDLHNFFLPDPQLCMAAYQSEERLLSELLDGADPPLTRAALASNLFWMNRNLALILRRGGESDKAIGRIDRALQVHEEFRDLPFPRQVVEDGYKTLIQWLRESEREAEVGAIINRQHEAKR